jgi:hypothetical protein
MLKKVGKSADKAVNRRGVLARGQVLVNGGIVTPVESRK